MERCEVCGKDLSATQVGKHFICANCLNNNEEAVAMMVELAKEEAKKRKSELVSRFVDVAKRCRCKVESDNGRLKIVVHQSTNLLAIFFRLMESVEDIDIIDEMQDLFVSTKIRCNGRTYTWTEVEYVG